MKESARLTRERTTEAPTKRRLVEVAIGLVLRRGFTATGVEQICAEAGVTKGAFFHHFPTKEAIGHAVMQSWSEMGMSIYSAARGDGREDPLDQLHRLFDVMTGLVEGSEEALSCVVGMMSQEMSATNAALRESCSRHLQEWVDFVSGLLADAKKAHRPEVEFDPVEIAWMLHSLWQGSLLVAKARQAPGITVRNLHHARVYVDSLFPGAGAVAQAQVKAAERGGRGRVSMSRKSGPKIKRKNPKAKD